MEEQKDNLPGPEAEGSAQNNLDSTENKRDEHHPEPEEQKEEASVSEDPEMKTGETAEPAREEATEEQTPAAETEPEEQKEEASASEDPEMKTGETAEPAREEATEEQTPAAETEPEEQREEAPLDESEEKATEETAPEKTAEEQKPEQAVEEQPSAEDHDGEEADAHPEVESDEHEEDQYAHEHHELPDYASMDEPQLVQAAEKAAREYDLNDAKNHLEAIRAIVIPRFVAERNEKLEEFVSSGGNEIDFDYRQPLRERFREVYAGFKEKRRKYLKDLEAQLGANLDRKRQLIEQLKELIDSQETTDKDLWHEFNALQEAWKSTGPVPRSDSNDLWRTYHFHVDRFFDLIKMNHELRDMEFKRNQEVKEQLCVKAEELAALDDLKLAFTGLQALHKEWKQTGPVPREFRDSLWERFSTATKKIHDRRHEYFDSLKNEREERIAKKKELCEKLEQVSLDRSGHQAWQKAIAEVNAILDEFKKVGRISHPENDAVWERLRAANRNFNKAKNAFYREQKQHQLENLQKKRALLELAESLKDSEDWKNTTREMKRIQAEWKSIGHVPRSESDKIWKAFRSACNHYFDRLGQRNKVNDAALTGNLETKKELLKRLESLEVKVEDEEAVEKLKTLIHDWKLAGPVPRDEREIETAFNNLLDTRFAELKLDRRETQRIRFENRVQAMAEGGDNYQLKRERDQLYRKLDEARKELQQLENNIGFFTSAKGGSPLLREAEKRIERQREHIESLEERLSILLEAEDGEA